jgi:hypothetical protein
MMHVERPGLVRLEKFRAKEKQHERLDIYCYLQRRSGLGRHPGLYKNAEKLYGMSIDA